MKPVIYIIVDKLYLKLTTRNSEKTLKPIVNPQPANVTNRLEIGLYLEITIWWLRASSFVSTAQIIVEVFSL